MLTIRFQDGQKTQTFDCLSDYLLERRCSKVFWLLDGIVMHSEARFEFCELVKRVIDEANICNHETIDTLQLHMTTRIDDGESKSITDFERVIDLVQERVSQLAANLTSSHARSRCSYSKFSRGAC